MDKLQFKPFLRAFILIVLVIFLVIAHYFMFIYLYPFIFAFLIAYLLQPIVKFIEKKWQVHHTIASYFAIFICCSFLFICTVLIIRQLIKELAHIIDILPTIFHTLNLLFIDFGQTVIMPFYHSLQTKFPFLPLADTLEINKVIPYISEKIYDSSSAIFQHIFASVSTIVTSISQTSMMLIFMIISIFIMTKDFEVIRKYSQAILPKNIRSKLTEIIFQLKKSTFGLVKTHFLLAAISSCLVFIGLLIIQVENILLLTIIIFLVDFIPYVGIGAIFIPWILFHFMNGSYEFTIQLTILYMVITIVRQFIEPKLIATHLGIHPLIALIILFISIQYFGIIGIFITPLILIGLSAIYHANIIPIIRNFIFEKK